MTTETVPGIEVLTRAECLRMLAAAPTGWLVFSTPLRPRMTLVNVALHGEEVLVRTGPGEAVLAAENAQVMTIGVSAMDEVNRTGWSVTVTGTARLVDPVVGSADGAAPHPWAPGLKNQVLAVCAEDVTGRRVTAGTPLGVGEACCGWWG